MWIKGVSCQRADNYGWRYPEDGDVDRDGNPIEDRHYVVLVRKKDCRTYTDDNGRRRYDPTGVSQAVKMNHGGTSYGYGKPRKKMGFMESGPNAERWGVVGYTTPFYAVRDGYVWKGTIKHTDVIYCPECGEPGRDDWFRKLPGKKFDSSEESDQWWEENHNHRVCTKCSHEWELEENY